MKKLIKKVFGPKEFEFNEMSNSARTTFTQCRKKFYWSYICRLAMLTENKAFMIGGLFHNTLETLYKDGVYNRDVFNQKIDEKVDKAANTCTSTEASDELWKQSALVKAMVSGYASFYLSRDIKVWKIIAPESKFAFKLKNGWMNRGMRDLMVRRGKLLELIEHKTTSRLDAGYMAKLPLDSQILSYALSCKHDFGEYPAHIIYNVIKKSQMRLKQTETMDQYSKRMEEEYLANPSVYFYREVLSFSKLDIDAYEVDLERFCVEVERAIKEKYYYCNYANCINYGICPYMQLCQAKTDKALEIALLSYRVKEVTHEELKEEE